MISICVHPTCTSCRKAAELLRGLDVEVERRDYFRNPFTRDELRSVLATAGRTPGEMVSTRARAYRDLDIAARQPSDDELIGLMVAEPRLLRRPLAIGRGRSAVGFDAAALTALADLERNR